MRTAPSAVASFGVSKRTSSYRGLALVAGLLVATMLVGCPGIGAPIEEDDIYIRSNPSNTFFWVECNLDAYDLGSTVSQYFYIWNAGDGTLDYTLSDNRSWLTLSPRSGSSTGEQDRIDVTMSTSGWSAGETQIATISVSGTVSKTNIGQFWFRTHEMVDPTGPLNFVACGGNPPPQSFQFGMNGAGWERWTATESASWLTLSTTSGTVSTNAQFDTIKATVDASSLAPGTYSTTITLSSYTQSYRQARQHYETTLVVNLTVENSPPTAADDNTSTQEDAAKSIAVLTNDSDPDGDTLSIGSVGSPAHGSAVKSGTNVVYTPSPGYCGSDSFTYNVSDGNGGTDSARVTVSVSCSEEEIITNRVVISEIAWAGTQADAADEWIELANVGETPVDLDGWVLRWRPNTSTAGIVASWTVIRLAGVLQPANGSYSAEIQHNEEDGFSYLVSPAPEETDGFLLLERGNDSTVVGIEAGIVYDLGGEETMSLPDEGARIELLDARGRVVDTANASIPSGWSAGSAGTRASMERIDPLSPDREENWRTSSGVPSCGSDARQNPLMGTAKSTNGSSLLDSIEFRIVHDSPGTDFAVALAGASVDGSSCGVTRARVDRETVGVFENVRPEEYSLRPGGWIDVDVGALDEGMYVYRFGCPNSTLVIAGVDVRR